ncbi:MAG: UDP-N-acetylmuramate dehydrogenase [Polyangiales bacterium]|nr:UDP-N-acetylmuramate dehydrogenase [Myxococcales bacterium]MCB9662109.1 UDP-N-acetylmuramate dehydrogenase [Sandaracinaceae bacterium]
MSRVRIDKDVSLSERTTLGLGGRAQYLARATSDDHVLQAVRHASDRGMPLALLAGGSNTLVPDEGFRGLVLSMETEGIHTDTLPDGRALLRVKAGTPWPEVVRHAVGADLAGLECLAGIPGSAGATPVQNVGAYGQEVSETIVSVRALDRRTLDEVVVGGEDCGFRYRDSRFKQDPHAFIVLEVAFALRPGGAPSLRYAELERALAGTVRPTLQQVHDTVIALRRAKGMVLDPDDVDSRSAGSFFTNPIVTASEAARVVERALSEGLVQTAEAVPRWEQADGSVKLAAGWLIECAGVRRGLRRGPVGVSSKHALALVHHGDGTMRELLALADEIAGAVHGAFGVALTREPQLLTGVVA